MYSIRLICCGRMNIVQCANGKDAVHVEITPIANRGYLGEYQKVSTQEEIGGKESVWLKKSTKYVKAS